MGGGKGEQEEVRGRKRREKRAGNGGGNGVGMHDSCRIVVGNYHCFSYHNHHKKGFKRAYHRVGRLYM